MCAIDGSKQGNDLLPGQGSRQFFQPVSARCIDLLVQRLPEYALGMLASKKTPQGRNDVLKAETGVGPGPVKKETLDLV
jgi:hypothetical protein